MPGTHVFPAVVDTAQTQVINILTELPRRPGPVRIPDYMLRERIRRWGWFDRVVQDALAGW